MDDSSFFMQWAMNTLDEHNSAAAAADAYGGGGGGSESAAVDSVALAFPSLQAMRSAAGSAETAVCVRDDLRVQVDHCSSWSSAESPGGGTGTGAMGYDAAAAAWSPHTARTRTTTTTAAAATGNRTMSWNFGAAAAQPTADVIALPAAAAAAAARGHTPSAVPGNKRGGGGGGVGSSAAAAAAPGVGASMSSPGPVQDHIIAERRRREKINQRFIELSTVIPGLKKMDKATILGDAVKYVRELQEKVKTMEEDESQRATSTTIQSTVLVKKKQYCSSGDDGDGGSGAAASEGGGGLPEIEARLSEKSVLVRIHCENARGLLVRLLAEVEDLRLAITHTSVMPFPAATSIITISAKVEERFNSTVEEMVRRFNSVLRQHYSNSSSSENSEKRSGCYS